MRSCFQVLFLSVLITNYTISDGKSNWRKSRTIQR